MPFAEGLPSKDLLSLSFKTELPLKYIFIYPSLISKSNDVSLITASTIGLNSPPGFKFFTNFSYNTLIDFSFGLRICSTEDFKFHDLPFL